MEFEKAKSIVDNFNSEVAIFLKENKMSELRQFSDLQTKENIGTDYRHDQWYFENISSFKAKYFSLRAYFLKLQSDNSERVLGRKIDGLLAFIDEQIKMLDITVATAKQRIKFYESVIYLVANFNYGNY
jgi:hypothetical protein